MARGGSSGGGSHSSGGSRSSGGSHSMGHHSSSSGFRGSGGGGGGSHRGSSGFGYSSSWRPGPPRPPRPGGYHRPTGYGYGYGYGGPVVVEHRHHSPVADIISAIALLIIIVVIASVYMGISFGGAGITKSTIAREKLDAGLCATYKDFFVDEINGIESSNKLNNGLKYFYQKTGIQPYVVITNRDGSESMAHEIYQSTFNDSGHLVLLFCVEGSGVDWDEYDYWIEVGDAAGTVFDAEADEILADYISRNWSNSALDNSEFLANSFKQAADRMMTKTPNYRFVSFVIGAVVALLYLAFKWWKHKKEQDNIEAEHTENILNADLNTFGSENVGDTDLKDLEDKYN